MTKFTCIEALTQGKKELTGLLQFWLRSAWFLIAGTGLSQDRGLWGLKGRLSVQHVPSHMKPWVPPSVVERGKGTLITVLGAARGCTVVTVTICTRAFGTYSPPRHCTDKDKYKHICPPEPCPWLRYGGGSRCGSMARPRVPQKEGMSDLPFKALLKNVLVWG